MTPDTDALQSIVNAQNIINKYDPKQFKDFGFLQDIINSINIQNNPYSQNNIGGQATPSQQQPDYSLEQVFGGKDTKEYREYKEGQKQGKWKDLSDYISQQGDPVTAMINTAKSRADDEKKFLDDYITDNPFVFDEALAKESATAEYEPYYTELLDDYLSGIELKRETIEDDRKLLDTIYQYDSAKNSRDYSKAISQANEGFAGKGMFFSGVRKATLGEAEVEKVSSDELGAAKHQYQERGLDRQSSSIDLQESQKKRDIAREQEAAITSGVETRRSEAMTQYYTPMIQSYIRKFGGGDTLAGYLPPEFLRY